MKNIKLTKSILVLLSAVLLLAACNQHSQMEGISTASEAVYPVDKIEFQKNGFMSDPDAKLLIENAKRSAALQVYLWSLPRTYPG